MVYSYGSKRRLGLMKELLTLAEVVSCPGVTYGTQRTGGKDATGTYVRCRSYLYRPGSTGMVYVYLSKINGPT